MDDREALLPLYTKRTDQCCLVPFKWFASVTVGLPFFAFLFCVYYSITYNFLESTATHCQVENYLPSVSAAIGSFSPQKYVWMVAIILHFQPRLAVAHQYYSYLSLILDESYNRLIRINRLCNIIEIICLLGLTLVSSTTFYPAHAFFFVTFVIMSIIYMVLSCYLFKNRRTKTSLETRSLRLKFYFTFINLIGFVCAGVYFVRHNKYCETGMYSYFALFEYLVVLSNMAFHWTAYYDFTEGTVTLSATGFQISRGISTTRHL